MGQRLIETLRANRGISIAGVVIVVLSLVVSAVSGFPSLFMVGLLVAFGLTTWGVYRWRSRDLDPRPDRVPLGSLASSGLVALMVVFLAAQVVPYGRDHSNPPTNGEPAWDTPQTRELVVRACFDCHSNEVDWPWYSNIAPASWAVVKHVQDGRGKVNYQEWGLPQKEGDESFDEVKKGSMAPSYYTFGGLHADAKLTSAELAALLDGLLATPGLSE